MDLYPVLLTIIAFSAVIAVLSTIFYALLNPVKENQASMEKRMDRIESKLDQLIAAKSA